MRNIVPPQQVQAFLEQLAMVGRKNSLRDPFALLIAESDLGPAQVHALLWLRMDGSLGMGALAQRSGVNQKTITGIVDRLERDGMVRRIRNDQDRRVVQVELAPKGEKLATKLSESLFENVKNLLEMLDERDRTDLFRIVGNIAAAVASISSETPHDS